MTAPVSQQPAGEKIGRFALDGHVRSERSLPCDVVGVSGGWSPALHLLSHRGAKGGYELARPAASISVPEMIIALEGPIGLTECTMHPGACAQESSCHVREPWQHINRAVRDALDGITLADLAAPSPGSGSILSLESLGVDTRDLDTRATS